MHLNMSSGKWRPFCPGLNVLMESCKQTMMYKNNKAPLMAMYDV